MSELPQELVELIKKWYPDGCFPRKVQELTGSVDFDRIRKVEEAVAKLRETGDAIKKEIKQKCGVSAIKSKYKDYHGCCYEIHLSPQPGPILVECVTGTAVSVPRGMHRNWVWKRLRRKKENYCSMKLMLSALGPYAFLCWVETGVRDGLSGFHHLEKPPNEKCAAIHTCVLGVLQQHGFKLLERKVVETVIPWMTTAGSVTCSKHPKVEDCLFEERGAWALGEDK